MYGWCPANRKAQVGFFFPCSAPSLRLACVLSFVRRPFTSHQWMGRESGDSNVPVGIFMPFPSRCHTTVGGAKTSANGHGSLVRSARVRPPTYSYLEVSSAATHA
jgi:hypothetical protein